MVIPLFATSSIFSIELMKRRWIPAIALLSTFCATAPALSENLEHTQQLISTKQCERCDLSNAGLVYANLTGADLKDANLVGANLSRANLIGANLSGANLAGAVLFNANLSGANLSGANLAGADVRGAILSGAVVQNVVTDNANFFGAVGAPTQIATAANLYMWGLAEAQRGNFRGAIGNYDQAISLKPDFAHAYLARGVSRFRLGDSSGAMADAQRAQQLYTSQNDAQGQQVATQFTDGVKAAQEAEKKGHRGGGSNFLNFLGSLASMLLQYVLP